MFSNREDAGWSEVKQAVIMVAEALDSMQVQFGICGGAAISLIREQQITKPRVTEDVDLVIQPDATSMQKRYPRSFLWSFPPNSRPSSDSA